VANVCQQSRGGSLLAGVGLAHGLQGGSELIGENAHESRL
jgi:hypothetical protein